jgi:hypothetical protein
MDEKNGIKIPDHLLDGAVNEQMTEPEVDSPLDGFVTDFAEKSISKLAGVFDETMKERGGVGLAGVDQHEFAKLGVVALEDMIPKEVLENSPKAAFGTMCVYIGAANAIAIKRNKNNQPKEDNNDG